MNHATSETFLASLRATARLKAQDLAEQQFGLSDLLYVDGTGLPAQPGLARHFGKTLAIRVCDESFALGMQAARDLALMAPQEREERA